MQKCAVLFASTLVLFLSSHCWANTYYIPEPEIIDAGKYNYVRLFDLPYWKRYLERNSNSKNCNTQTQPADNNKVCKIERIISQYTASGLYNKNDPSLPIWEGEIVGKLYISSDGHFVVSLNEGGALSFYYNGKEIASYRSEILVDDKSYIVAPYFRWISFAKFNDAKAQYTLKTVDNNLFVFDIHSGEIASYTQLPNTKIYADISLPDGRVIKSARIAACGIMDPELAFKGIDINVPAIGAATNQKLLIGWQGTEEIYTAKLDYIPLTTISKIELVRRIDQKVFAWKVTDNRGEQKDIKVNSDDYDFCIYNEYDIKKIELGTIKQAIIHKQINVEPRIKPSLKMRQAWDVKNIEEARNRLCNDESLTRQNSIDKNVNLVNLYNEARCNAAHLQFVSSVNAINTWIVTLPNNEKLEALLFLMLETNARIQQYANIILLLEKYEVLRHSSITIDSHFYSGTYISVLYKIEDLVKKSKPVGDSYKDKARLLIAISDIKKQIHVRENAERVQSELDLISGFKNGLVPPHEFVKHRYSLLDGGGAGLLLRKCAENSMTPDEEYPDVFRSLIKKEQQLHSDAHEHIRSIWLYLSVCYLISDRRIQAKNASEQVFAMDNVLFNEKKITDKHNMTMMRSQCAGLISVFNMYSQDMKNEQKTEFARLLTKTCVSAGLWQDFVHLLNILVRVYKQKGDLEMLKKYQQLQTNISNPNFWKNLGFAGIPPLGNSSSSRNEKQRKENELDSYYRKRELLVNLFKTTDPSLF